MRKRVFGLLLAGMLAFGLSAVPAHAEDLQGGKGWKVSFDGSDMESNFKSKDLTEAAQGLQPGDSITFTVSLQNSYSKATDWWMTNEVLESFEDASIANGGAYTYILTYADKDGEENVLYSSESVGGEDTQGGEGLHKATGALEDYFYLDTLAKGAKGTVTLKVALDGETQGNDYQDTLANLRMNFAVEINDDGDTTNNNPSDGDGSGRRRSPNSNPGSGEVVKTGDSTDILPYVLMMAASGAVVLIFAIITFKKNKEDKEGGAA